MQRKYPKQKKYYLLAAKAYAKINKRQEMDIIINKAIENGLNKGEYFIVKGDIAQTRYLYNEAMKYYNKALEFDKANIQYWLKKTKLLYKQRLLEKALFSIKEGLKYSPHNQIGKELKKSIEDTIKREKVYRQGKNHSSPKNIDPPKIQKIKQRLSIMLYNRGEKFIQEKSLKEALWCFDTIIKIHPYFLKGMAVSYKSHTLNRLHRYSEALIWAKKAMKQNQNNQYAWLGMADALTGLKHYKKALIYYKKAKQISPNDPFVWLHMGNYYKAIDDLVNMKKHFDQYQILLKKARRRWR